MYKDHVSEFSHLASFAVSQQHFTLKGSLLIHIFSCFHCNQYCCLQLVMSAYTVWKSLLYLWFSGAFRKATQHHYDLCASCQLPFFVSFPSIHKNIFIKEENLAAGVRIEKKGSRHGSQCAVLDSMCVILVGFQGPPVMGCHALCLDNSPLPYLNALCWSFIITQRDMGKG